ncbi:MAG TPA: exopolysaccharide biosynthesis protein [Vitreimonas sp.]|uniref:exopolysaccharide biosynthesis protein n=1 Tax=Vitreimonas sp. TaxID=3069702 RepID=UPI002D6729B5|nr:exopolysaccharide biosynthesis protein [Vitreimonas sp.]HYD87529.1 exopolysaccharide biosynthesis protein [Vitreimonas sp.]
MSADTVRDDLSRSFIGVLQRIDSAAGADGLSIGGIADQLDERAFGLLILLLTLPCLVPGLPGAQIIAIGIFLLAAQVLIGRSEPWLPGWFMRMRVKKSWISTIAGFADKRLRWTERFARPRWRFFAAGFGEKIAALIMALAAITVMLPITNTVPSVALTLMSIGLIQRDGVFTVLGSLVALGWLTLLGVLITGLVVGAGFAVDLLSQHAPWLADLFGR